MFLLHSQTTSKHKPTKYAGKGIPNACEATPQVHIFLFTLSSHECSREAYV